MVSSTLSFKAIASIFSVITAVNAHMIMKTPIPYGRGVINNSPLNNDGSDFPCKGLFDMTDPVNDVNHLVPGVANTLSFTGSAVHGGGSCQVSLTTDLKPTKDSKWMVIKSIEGGCPANVPGNLPDDPSGDGASKFQYTVPAGFPSGSYTIAWTWFNKVGNREMYMNCGRAEIGAAKKRYAPTPKNTIQHRAADYPDIFKANLVIFGTCKVPDSTIVSFPNPGSSLEKVVAGTPPTGCGTGADTAPPSGGSGSSAAAGAQTSAATASASGSAGGFNTGSGATATAGRSTATGGFASGGVSATGSRGVTQATGNPGVFASGAASQSAPAATGTASATVAPTAQASATVAPVPQATPAANGSNGTTPSTGSNTAGSPCTQEGAWLCAADGKSFQRCASGLWSISMPVAAGTSCTPGQSMNFNMAVSGSQKRDLHYHRIAHRRALQLSS